MLYIDLNPQNLEGSLPVIIQLGFYAGVIYVLYLIINHYLLLKYKEKNSKRLAKVVRQYIMPGLWSENEFEALFKLVNKKAQGMSLFSDKFLYDVQSVPTIDQENRIVSDTFFKKELDELKINTEKDKLVIKELRAQLQTTREQMQKLLLKVKK